MKTNNYALGLDIGITSVGFGVIDLDSGEAIDYGVRLFEESNPENNQTRRAKRSGRRMKSRKRNRLNDLKALMKNEGLGDYDDASNINPYEVRVKGLHEKLSPEELKIALYHLTKMRGTSFEVVGETSEDEGTKLQLQQNDQLLKEGKYICEIQQARFQETGKIHGSENNFRTKSYIDEVKQILSNQDVSEEFKKKIIELIGRRRDFSDGPGSQKSPTPYGRWTEFGQLEPIDLIEKMKGKCSVYPDQFRAAKNTYKADLFNFLNDLNNLTIKDRKLTKEKKEELLKIIEKKGTVTPKELCKFLDESLDNIKGFRIDTKENPILTEFKGFKKVKKVLDGTELYHNHDLVDEIIEELTKNKELNRRKEALRKLSDEFTEEQIEELANLKQISGYHALSAKALNELNKELLETENNQMQILSLREHNSKKLDFLKGRKNIVADDEAILSPVAKRAQREAIKVVNRLREIHGEFNSIVIETTRAKNSLEEKQAIRDKQKFFENENKKAEKLLEDAKSNAKLNGKLRLKLRLYEEQCAKTAYELRDIDLGLLISDPTAYEIDHIIPVSISLDDSYSNKVLVTRYENQVKGNLTPIQAFDKGLFKNCTKEEFIANAGLLRKTNGKRFEKKLYNLTFGEDLTKFDTMKDFINRNLVDTSYANRVVLNTLQDYYKINEIPTKVFTVKGSATHMFRQRIKLEKDRDDITTGYAHHAIDALIIASIMKFPRFNQLLNRYRNETFYDHETGEVSDVMTDDKFFDEKYLKLVSTLFSLEKDVVKFSHKIDTKPNRQIADETIYSTRDFEGETYVVKKYKNIYDPKEVHIANDILSGNVDKYLMYKHSPETFEYLSDIIRKYAEQFKDDEKIFDKSKNEFKSNPLAIYKEENGLIRKPSKKGNGPVIESMKYIDSKLGNHIDVTSKNVHSDKKKIVVLQISPYRTDFYYSKDKGYKFVTVRYSNVFYSKSKECYVIDKQWYEGEKKKKQIDDSFEFCFSLHHNELVKIMDDSKTNGLVLKYVATNNDSSNKVECKPIDYYDKERIIKTIGKKIELIEKYATDVCGNRYKVENQTLKLEWK